MRQLIAGLLAFLIVSCFVGCSGANVTAETMPTDSSGNMMNVADSGTTTYAKNLPCPCDYNGSNIYLTSVDFYELYSDDYTYTLFTIVRFDVSQLSESDLHWLREEDMDVYSLYRVSDDSYEFEHLGFRGSLLLTDTKELIYVFDSVFEESRHSFAGKTIAITCNVTQEEEYQANSGNTVHSVNSISYSVNTPDVIDSVDKIESILYSYIAKWLGEAAEFYSKIG
jgi:hypothetical protein